jgi:hypothetical protein
MQPWCSARDIAQAHTANEWIVLRQVEDATAILVSSCARCPDTARSRPMRLAFHRTLPPTERRRVGGGRVPGPGTGPTRHELHVFAPQDDEPERVERSSASGCTGSRDGGWAAMPDSGT